ncbi:T9SS type A sorting domain-containing protein [Dyadobacter sandarakinus]|uniref:T9SS type A sorting domain-containing protein n=1 Tax=Dyadobacter sandarakinus TaxID=2747268 RepID=A0ABX7I4D9_9BACT|nr:T9SS type A sorting domain-containing protein [Dyadobacter sandarakinus]QRR00735.1 T9SS type A sorting domain-containing protein [Dyadobacter sandarakinus]
MMVQFTATLHPARRAWRQSGLKVLMLALIAPASAYAQGTDTLLVARDAASNARMTVFQSGGFVLSGVYNPFEIGVPATGAGTRLMWYPGKSAFRAGSISNALWDDAYIGEYSIAMGNGARATGEAATAFGLRTGAVGPSSFAAGEDSYASGAASVALGYHAHTNARQGSFVFSDRSSVDTLRAGVNHSANWRTSGGFRIFTTSNLSTGVTIQSGASMSNWGQPAAVISTSTGAYLTTSGVWQNASDVHRKHLFEAISNEDVLEKLRRLPVTRWSYKSDPEKIRHIGPMAQDFYAAFGLGSDERSIGTVDADGVAMAGIKALEERTRNLASELESLRADNAALRQTLHDQEHDWKKMAGAGLLVLALAGFFRGLMVRRRIMKTLGVLMAVAGLGAEASAQGLSSRGGALTLKGGILQVKGDLQLDGGTFTNNGNFFLSGNLVNNQSETTADTGTITFDGNTLQTVSGSVFYLSNHLTINNPAGIVLNNPVEAGGTVTFTNGAVDATQVPLILGENAIVEGVSDVSHVTGNILKRGLGSFTYPTGGNGRYQPVTVDLTENSNGLIVRYVPEDAGTAPFAGAGTKAALEAYNNQEYWDIIPAGTATGRVTLFWDDFRNPSLTTSENLNVYSVAHLTGGNWVNEGSGGAGTPAAGSVTSALISTWSPFALGVVSESGLPVTMISFNARLVENTALLEWQTTSEDNASHFDIERSLDARSYRKIGSVKSAGTGEVLRRYSFSDPSFPGQQQTVYYRLRAVDHDGTFSLTRALSLSSHSTDHLAKIYPNPAGRTGMVTVTSAGSVTLWDMLGRQVPVRTSALADGSVQVSLSGIHAGLYFLRSASGDSVVSHKLVVE